MISDQPNGMTMVGAPIARRPSERSNGRRSWVGHRPVDLDGWAGVERPRHVASFVTAQGAAQDRLVEHDVAARIGAGQAIAPGIRRPAAEEADECDGVGRERRIRRLAAQL